MTAHCQGCRCPIDQRILETLKRRGPMDMVELVSELAVSPRLVLDALDRMWNDAQVVRGIPWGEFDHLVYSVVDDG